MLSIFSRDFFNSSLFSRDEIRKTKNRKIKIRNTGNKTIINEYQKKIAMAYLEYAFVDIKDIEDYETLGYTASNAKINNRL